MECMSAGGPSMGSGRPAERARAARRRTGLQAVVADAAVHVAQLAGVSPGSVDLAVVDLFDGADAVPADVLSPGEARYASPPRPPCQLSGHLRTASLPSEAARLSLGIVLESGPGADSRLESQEAG